MSTSVLEDIRADETAERQATIARYRELVKELDKADRAELRTVMRDLDLTTADLEADTAALAEARELAGKFSSEKELARLASFRDTEAAAVRSELLTACKLAVDECWPTHEPALLMYLQARMQKTILRQDEIDALAQRRQRAEWECLHAAQANDDATAALDKLHGANPRLFDSEIE